MKLKLVQDIINLFRGKKKLFYIIKLPKIKRDIYNSEIDELFDKFETKEIIINGKKRKKLANVNAMRGVTESSLTVLCKLYPDKEERKNIKVLNVACGRKNQNDFIRELGFQVYGIDFDIEENTDFIKFHNLNTQDDLPFQQKMFDCVIAQEIIEHIENPWLLFRKIKKVLKLNGNLIVTTPNIVSSKNKQIFVENNYGFFEWFNDKEIWQHINPIPYWEIVHISQYNGFDLKHLTGNLEYYVEFCSTKNEYKRDTSLKNNDVLLYVFKKRNDEENKLYSPIPTYNFNKEIFKKTNNFMSKL